MSSLACSTSLAVRPVVRLQQRVDSRRLPSGLIPAQAVFDLSRPSGRSAAVSALLPTIDPAADSETRVVGVHSPSEFSGIVKANSDKLVVLMCKAKSCRPCKAFTHKYKLIADRYADALFYEIYGDETKDTRQMMIRMGVRVTPFFVLYRNGEKVHAHGGVNEDCLHRAIQEQLLEGEAGLGSYQLALSEAGKGAS